jgi:hypothetical protein
MLKRSIVIWECSLGIKRENYEKRQRHFRKEDVDGIYLPRTVEGQMKNQ